MVLNELQTSGLSYLLSAAGISTIDVSYCVMMLGMAQNCHILGIEEPLTILLTDELSNEMYDDDSTCVYL